MTELFTLRPPRRGLPQHHRTFPVGMHYDELQAWLGGVLPHGARHTRSVFQQLHAFRVRDFTRMSMLGRSERETLACHSELPSLTIESVHASGDGTRKFRLRTLDDKRVEAVLIPSIDRRTNVLCISSQVGCAVDCRFCATASLGLERNLDTWEIVDQVYRVQDVLASEHPGDDAARITNLVFMGMGEPLHNFVHVRRALAILTHGLGANFSSRRITLSTAGLVPAIERFGRENVGKDTRLAISLNATTDEIRDQIMPINRRWNIATLLDAVRRVPRAPRQRVIFEYVLLAGINDSDADAHRLVALLRDFRCNINVIPFNPHPAAPYRRPTPERVQDFLRICRASGILSILRTTRGDDIAAACGQLALLQSTSAGAPLASQS